MKRILAFLSYLFCILSLYSQTDYLTRNRLHKQTTTQTTSVLEKQIVTTISANKLLSTKSKLRRSGSTNKSRLCSSRIGNPQLILLRQLLHDRSKQESISHCSTKAMDNFIRLTSIDDENIILIDNVNGTYKKGDHVRIIAGAFKGIEGRVTKITGQKRVIVELPGLCSVATAYIPKAFIKNRNNIKSLIN